MKVEFCKQSLKFETREFKVESQSSVALLSDLHGILTVAPLDLLSQELLLVLVRVLVLVLYDFFDVHILLVFVDALLLNLLVQVARADEVVILQLDTVGVGCSQIELAEEVEDFVVGLRLLVLYVVVVINLFHQFLDLVLNGHVLLSERKIRLVVYLLVAGCVCFLT